MKDNFRNQVSRENLDQKQFLFEEKKKKILKKKKKNPMMKV